MKICTVKSFLTDKCGIRREQNSQQMNRNCIKKRARIEAILLVAFNESDFH